MKIVPALLRMKRVNTEEYLRCHYKITPEILDLELDEIEVISVRGIEQFFYEFEDIR